MRKLFPFFLVIVALLSGCQHATENHPSERSEVDIVNDPFEADQAAVLQTLEKIASDAGHKDFEALENGHLESPKFTKFARGRMEILDFDAMIQGETANFWQNLQLRRRLERPADIRVRRRGHRRRGSDLPPHDGRWY